MFDLTGKSALVTGAASGIGEAIARALAAHGAFVYVADVNAAAGQSVANSLGDRGTFLALDIADRAAVQAVAARVQAERKQQGGIDVLVNNAGVGSIGTVLTTTDDELDRLYRVNVKGTLYMTQAFLPAMVERRQGSIVNIASIGGVTGVRDRLAYCATKHAVVGLTRCTAIDFAHTRVRCNAICPGRVETPWVAQRIREYPDPKKAYEEMAATQALNRMGTPDEIAAAAVYLASDESAFTTGSALILDGGWTAGK